MQEFWSGGWLYSWHLKVGIKFIFFNIISSKEIKNFHPEISKPSSGEFIPWRGRQGVAGNQPHLCLLRSEGP